MFNKFRKFIIQARKGSCLFSSIKYHKLLSRFPLVVKRRKKFMLENLSVEIFTVYFFIIIVWKLWTFALRILEDKESFYNDKNYFCYPSPPLILLFLKKDYSSSLWRRIFKDFSSSFLYFLSSSSSSSFYRLILYSILKSLCFTHSWYLKNKLYSSYFLVTVKSLALFSLVC